ncbi:MAG: universal stress protein [Acidobacteriota bacterium]|nr:universal stress protein [Acidobacteriota bacterium]
MYSSILVAVDDSEQSQRAVSAAGELARLSGATVHLFHVRERQDVIGKSGGSFDVEDAEEVTALLERSVAALSDSGVTTTTKSVHVPIGHVANEIVKAAAEAGADTIVMGSHGRSSLAAVVLGSNAYKVLHLADRPVLVVR